MDEIIYKAYIHYLYCKTNSDGSNTENFSYKKMEDLGGDSDQLVKTKTGVDHLTLSYIIRKETTPLTMDHSKLKI